MVQADLRANPSVLASVMQSLDRGYLDKVDKERAELLRFALRLTAENNSGTANLGAALRVLFMHDQEMFEQVSSIYETRLGDKTMSFAYDRAKKAKVFERVNEGLKPEGEVRAAVRAIDSDSGAGDDDFATLFVEKTIKRRVESASQILQYCDVRRLVTKSSKFPKSSNTAKALFAAKSDDLTDLTATIDGGFDQTDIEAQKFGGTMFLERDAFVKLDAEVLTQILEELVFAYSRGLRDQIYNGDGNTPNATGMSTNATSIAWAGTFKDTLIKMAASIANVTRGGSKDIFGVTNTAALITLVGEKFINQSFNDLIDAMGLEKGSVNFLKTLPIIEDNVIVTSGSSPNVAAPFILGKRGDYLVGIQQDPTIEMDQYSDFKAGGQTARIMGFWMGKPHFNNSFSKVTIPTLY